MKEMQKHIYGRQRIVYMLHQKHATVFADIKVHYRQQSGKRKTLQKMFLLYTTIFTVHIQRPAGLPLLNCLWHSISTSASLTACETFFSGYVSIHMQYTLLIAHYTRGALRTKEWAQIGCQ